WLARGAPAPARRTPLVGRRELHHRARRHQDPAPAARADRRAARRRLGLTSQAPDNTRCGCSAERPWKARMAGLTTCPSRISIARWIVSSSSHASGPASTVPTNGSNASLITQVAEFQRYDGLWSTP